MKDEQKQIRKAITQNRVMFNSIKHHPQYKDYLDKWETDIDFKINLTLDINKALKVRNIYNASSWTLMNLDIMRMITITAKLLQSIKEPWITESKEATIQALEQYMELTKRSATRLYNTKAITHLSIDNLVQIIFYWYKYDVISNIYEFMTFKLMPLLLNSSIDDYLIETLGDRVAQYSWFKTVKK
jgi:hypothetical protein